MPRAVTDLLARTGLAKTSLDQLQNVSPGVIHNLVKLIRLETDPVAPLLLRYNLEAFQTSASEGFWTPSDPFLSPLHNHL